MIVLTETKQHNDDLSAALYSSIAEYVPHKASLTEEVKEIIDRTADREKLFIRVAELCAPPQTPKQLFLTAKAYSWLGKEYYNQVIQYAREYLLTDGWDEISSKAVLENGIYINSFCAHNASLLSDLAKAEEGIGRLDEAQFHFEEAYRLEPYSAMYAVKAADVIVKLKGQEEALNYLRQQKKNQYYKPVKYTDPAGNIRYNDEFRRLIDAHIFKLETKN
jgi:tetratricopeptide (TPR) repeat protein